MSWPKCLATGSNNHTNYILNAALELAYKARALNSAKVDAEPELDERRQACTRASDTVLRACIIYQERTCAQYIQYHESARSTMSSDESWYKKI